MFSIPDIQRHRNNVNIFKVYSYAQLLKECVRFPFDYYFGAGKAAFPLQIVLFLTLRCNVRCTLCNADISSHNESPIELTIEQVDGFLASLGQQRPHIFFMGGEPLLRKDSLDIVSLTKRKGFRCGISTNGVWLPHVTV